MSVVSTVMPEKVIWTQDEASMAGAAERYREDVSSLYEVTLLGKTRAFYNRFEGYSLGGASLGRRQGVAQRLQRTRAHARHDGAAAFQVTLCLSGDWRGDFDGRLAEGGAGSIRAVDMARPFDLTCEDFETLNLMLPRRALGADVGRDLHGTTLTGDRGLSRLLKAHLESLWTEVDHLSKAEGIAATAAVSALAGAAFRSVDEAKAADLRPAEQARWTDALAYVDANLDDCDLGPETLRAHLGVTRGALYRLFAATGGVAIFIQSRRLDRAFDDIMAAAGTRVSVADIAHRNGFRSDAHFSRAFHNRFGTPPSEMKGRHRPSRRSPTANGAETLLAQLAAMP